MTERQKECLEEIQELILSINSLVKKYDLENEFISCITVGFLDMDNAYIDEDGSHRADMSLMSSFSVTDEEELDDMLSYCVEAFRMEQEENKPDPSSIDYWINLAKGDDNVN
jgi:hypothetical protein